MHINQSVKYPFWGHIDIWLSGASNRAMKWLKQTGTVTPEEYVGVQDALKWAARTYLVAALGSLAQLLYWASMLMGRRD